MATHADESTSLPSLLRGIVTDVRELLREELALAQAELRGELRRARTAALQMGVALAALALGVLLLLIAAAQALAAWLEWPAWAGYALVALVLIVAGVVAQIAAHRQMRLINGPQQTVHTMKENARWITTRMKSSGK